MRSGPSIFSPLLTLSLTFLLAVYTVLAYPLGLVSEVALTTLLLVVILGVGLWPGRGRFFPSSVPRKIAPLPASPRLGEEFASPLAGGTEGGKEAVFSYSVSSHWSSGPLLLFLLVLSITVTVQTLIARDLYGALRAIDRTSGYPVAIRLLHYLVVAAIVLGRGRPRLVGLGAAMLYASILYGPTFALPEVAAPFVPLIALALVLLATLPAVRFSFRDSRLMALTLFIGLALLAALFSYAPYDSLVWLFKLLTLVVFALILAQTIQSRAEWRRVFSLIALIAVGLPTIMGLVKLVQLAGQLGFWPAVAYRLNPNELGRANLLSRTLVGGLPLVAVLAWRATGWPERAGWWGLAGMAGLVFVAAHSWGGWMALALTIGAAAAIHYQPGRGRSYRFWLIGGLLGLAGLIGAVWLASWLNIRSFNGRLFQFRTALQAIMAHPWLGVGPGHYYLKSAYTIGLGWLVDTQLILDDPLRPIRALRGSTPLHTHNLFLEIGFGTGLAGLAVFCWFLVALFRQGWQTVARLSGRDRAWLIGCLAGIVASIGWGLLDVMEISSPFFTFPTWGLVGLLLAAPRVLLAEKPPPEPSFLSGDRWQAVRFVALSLLAFGFVLMPLVSNLHYRQGYVAYQERRWQTAITELNRAARWSPLNPKYPQLRAEAFINQGQYQAALAAYERALSLKRDFAPYHAQLGWLSWLQGDLGRATAHLEQAIALDPREAWQQGLHADLGLAFLAQGREDEALSLFKESLELEPETALAPYWIQLPESGGGFYVGLDPAYLGGPSPELDKRILAQLGRADYTPRLFGPVSPVDNALAFQQVLEAIQAANPESERAVSRQLARLAEASHLAGLEAQAEQFYLDFQAVQPDSAYGFRELGRLYREQGRAAAAEKMLEQAVSISPQDVSSWVSLAELYTAQARTTEAETALATIYRLRPVEAQLYSLRARLYQKQGHLSEAVANLRRALVIEESIPNRLWLAGLYRRQDQPEQATAQCLTALETLRRSWPRPLDPQLWEIGVCLAQSEQNPEELLAFSQPFWAKRRFVDSSLIDYIMAGHIYRARGQFELAGEAYQAAAEIRPDEGGPHYFLAETYRARGQMELAGAAYRRAAELMPQESLPLLSLGELHWAQEQPEAAIESFQAARRTTPGWPDVYIALGNAFLLSGNQPEAARNYHLAQRVGDNVAENLGYDFMIHLADPTTEREAPDPNYIKLDNFNIEGMPRRTLFMHPPARVRYAVEIEPEMELAFQLAMAPESWSQAGDGVTFSVYVQTDATEERLFSAYIDPKQEESARRWHAHTVDLGPYAGRQISLIFETDPGPNGDARYDWAGWGEARLLKPLGAQ